MTPAELSGERGQAIGHIARSYEQLMCRTFSRTLLEDIKYYYDRGLEKDVIVRAIEITATKSSADWRYTKGILNRLLDEGIKTLEVWEDRQGFKKNMLDLKRQFPFHSEDELFPFAVIATYRHYYENIGELIAESEKKPFKIEDIVDFDDDETD